MTYPVAFPGGLDLGPSSWQPCAFVVGPFNELGESRSAEFLWENLNSIAVRPDWARVKLSLDVHKERCGFIRQAQTYWDAATLVEGASAALLYYYCFLNLAKAELIADLPSEMMADPQHGLGFRPSQQDDFATARLEVTNLSRIPNQVFWFLYKKRTGKEWPVGEKTLSIKECLQRIPDVAYEATKLGYEYKIATFYHAATIDEARRNARSEILVYGLSHVQDDAELFARLVKLYTPRASLYAAWRDVFALSRRAWGADHVILQGEQIDIRLNDGYRADLGMGTWFPRIANEVGANIEPATTSTFDGIIVPGIQGTSVSVLTTDLARYALYFYVSSLVRYRPSALSDVDHPEQAWLFNSFTRQAALPLLHGFCNQITASNLIFWEGRR